MADKKGLDPEILACLEQIIAIMKEDDLSEVCIGQKDMKIKVRRMLHQSEIVAQNLAMLATESKTSSSADTDGPEESDGFVIFVSPMVGTFYRAASPESEPFVNVGDAVKADQVICVVDAMKLMNEVTADIDGVIAEILVEDGQPVEYDQPIFRIKPR